MLISFDAYLFSIIVLEIAVIVAAIIMRNKSSILRENLRFYMDARSTISATVCILIITFVISRFLKCQRMEIIPFLILSIFVAPVFEEIFYRGLLIGSLRSILERKGFEGKIVALSLIIINPFIFSLSHVLDTYTFRFDAFIVRLSTGFVYALFYWYGKRNLVPVIVAHSIYNLLVNLCLFSYP